MKLPALIVSAFMLAGAPAQAQPDWQPARTWVFAVGVLQFHDKADYAGFPQAYRADARLIKLLKKKGVPADHITYIQDKNATKASILAALPQLLNRTSAGDFLLFYYCGHGSPGKSHKVYFTPFDATRKDSSLWAVDSIFKTLEAHFKGSRAWLLADCCYSGGMAGMAAKRPSSPIAYASLTSSNSREESTGAWTFTEALIDGLSGNPVVDLNHDGKITLGEMGRFVESEMVFADEQLSGMASTSGFPDSTVLALASGPAPSGRLGERVEAEEENSWWRARIVAQKGASCKVHYYGYDSTQDAWRSPAQIRRPPRIPIWANGAKVQAEAEGKWYPATIKSVKEGVYFIHYDGYDSSEDEWLGHSQIKKR